MTPRHGLQFVTHQSFVKVALYDNSVIQKWLARLKYPDDLGLEQQ
jgi:hypothetical protein